MRRHTLFIIKKFILNLALSLPVVRNAVFYRSNRRILYDQKALIGKLQKIGHAIDLRTQNNGTPLEADIHEFYYILRKLAKKHAVIDDAVIWAAGIVVPAMLGLKIAETDGPKPAMRQGTVDNDVLLQSAMIDRRSIRAYTDEPVDERAVHDVIDIAKWAPTSCNRQLWRVKIVKDRHEIDYVSNYFSSEFCRKAPLLLLVLMDVRLYGDNEKHFAYLDGGAFIQNMLLLLHSKGLGACWLGFKGWDTRSNIFVQKEKYEEFYKHFSLDKSEVPISMIAVGHPRLISKPPLRQSKWNIIK